MKAKDYFYRIGQSDASLGRKASLFRVLYGGHNWPAFAVDAYTEGFTHQRQRKFEAFEPTHYQKTVMDMVLGKYHATSVSVQRQLLNSNFAEIELGVFARMASLGLTAVERIDDTIIFEPLQIDPKRLSHEKEAQ